MAEFCRQCGNKLNPGAKFCPSCGKGQEGAEIQPVTVEFSVMRHMLGFGGSKKVALCIDAADMHIQEQWHVMFFKGKQHHRVVRLQDIAAVRYEKRISIFMVVLAIAIAFLLISGGHVKFSWMALFLLYGLFNKNFSIVLKNGEIIAFKTVNTTAFIKSVCDALHTANPSIWMMI